MCIVQCLLHCWPHKGTSLCSCRCGFWLAALQSGDLQTKELFRMCSTAKDPAVSFTAGCTQKNLFGAMRLKKCFCFHLQQLYVTWPCTGLKLQVIQAVPNIELLLEYLLSSVALDLCALVGTHSVLRLVAGFRFLWSMHILEEMNPGKICSGAKRFRPFPRYLPPSISGVKVVLKETKKKELNVMNQITWRMHGANWFVLYNM